MAIQIEGCRALVTGGNRGIDQGFVEEIVETGAAHIYIGARNPENAKTLASSNPDSLTIVELDTANEEQVPAAEQCTDINLLVNNAGAFNMQTLNSASDMSATRSEIEVNYLGVVSMRRAFAPVIESNSGGAIAKAGLHAEQNAIDKHDTDPHAISVRAALPRDPTGLTTTMAKAIAAKV